jgi:hypothetical protein
MLSDQVYDVIDVTRANLQQHKPQSADEARQAGAMAFGTETAAAFKT